jgi:hypothetical protein
MLLENPKITLENFTKQSIIFTELGVKAYLKDFVKDEFDGDYVIIDFYKRDNNGNFNEIEGEQDVEIYTNETVDNLIRNIKGYANTII